MIETVLSELAHIYAVFSGLIASVLRHLRPPQEVIVSYLILKNNSDGTKSILRAGTGTLYYGHYGFHKPSRVLENMLLQLSETEGIDDLSLITILSVIKL